MDTCLTCNGAIMEPGKTYSYSGKICHCSVPPKIQRPASLENAKPDLAPGWIACMEYISKITGAETDSLRSVLKDEALRQGIKVKE